MANLALFDFDGTITKKDSFLEFIRFSKGGFVLYITLFIFSPYILYTKLIYRDASAAKEKVLRFLYKGTPQQKLIEQGAKFAKDIIPRILHEKAVDKIQWHKKNGTRVIVVSASLDFWLKPWTSKEDIELLCTEMGFVDGFCTGNFTTPNCNGYEKVIRIGKHLDLKEYSNIYAYGNSIGDLPMIELANHQFFCYFNK